VARPYGDLVNRLAPLLRITGLCAASMTILAGCARPHEDRAMVGQMSIKDAPATHDTAAARVPIRLHRASAPAGTDAHRGMTKMTSAGEPVASKTRASAQLASAPPTGDTVVKLPAKEVAAPLPLLEPKPLAKPSVASDAQPPSILPSAPLAVVKPSLPTAVTNDALPPAPRAAVDARPTAEARRVAANVEPAIVPKPPAVVMPQPVVLPDVAVAVPQTDAPSVPPAAPTAPTIVLVPKSNPTPVPPAALPANTAPKGAPLPDTQRVSATLASAEGYLRAGRVQNARALLEDNAKTGNIEILQALAETYDPLVLPDKYPKLARIGDAPRAIFYYEQAKANGALALDSRLVALKALAGRKSP
jgi:hypothetical protein